MEEEEGQMGQHSTSLVTLGLMAASGGSGRHEP